MSPRRWTGEILTKAGRRSTHPPHQCCSLSPLPWKSVCPLRPKLLEEERLIYSGRTPESGQDSLLGRTSLRPSLITPCPGHSSNNVCRGWAPTSVPDSFKLLSPSLGKRAHSIFTPVERRGGVSPELRSRPSSPQLFSCSSRRERFVDTLSGSVQSLSLTLCDPMDFSMPCLPVHHQLLEFTQTHVHYVSDAIQPSHPLSSPSPPAFNLSQHQDLSQWISSSHQVAKGLELQLQHQSFQ